MNPLIKKNSPPLLEMFAIGRTQSKYLKKKNGHSKKIIMYFMPAYMVTLGTHLSFRPNRWTHEISTKTVMMNLIFRLGFTNR